MLTLHTQANTWDDIVSEDGESLLIGAVTVPRKDAKQFVGGKESPPPREIKAAMALLLHLVLKHYQDREQVSDSLMSSIACSPAAKAVHKANVCSKNNSKVVEDFLNFLSFNLTFNEWSSRTKFDVKNQDVCKSLRKSLASLARNHSILVHYLRSHKEAAFDVLYPTGLLPDMPTVILQRRHTILDKLTNGVLIAYPQVEGKENTSSNGLWIHHLFFFQFILPVVYNDFLVKGLSIVPGYTETVDDFLTSVHLKYVPGYGCTGEFFDFVVWMGRDIR
jgi:hypothetical protein